MRNNISTCGAMILIVGGKLRRWASPTLEFWHFIFHRAAGMGRRSRSRSGRRGGGGRCRSLSRFPSRSHAHSHSHSHSQSSASDDGEHAANQHKTTSSGSDGPSSDGGWFSWGSGGWFSFETVECKDLYQSYKKCVNLRLEDREKDVYGYCSMLQEDFEESCGKKYKSLLSSWWTEKDEIRLLQEIRQA
ncbi:hypothetical protein SLA2020_218770 [Shorea laevis]